MPNQRFFESNQTRIPKEFPIERVKNQTATFTLIHTAGDKSNYKIDIFRNGQRQRSMPVDEKIMAPVIASGQPYLLALFQSLNEQALASELSNAACEPIPAIVESLRTPHCSVALSLADEEDRPPGCDFGLSLRMMSDTASPQHMFEYVSNAVISAGVANGMRPLLTALVSSPAIWNHILNNDPMLISEKEKQSILAAIQSSSVAKPKQTKSI